MSARGTCFLHFKMWRNTTLWCVRRREMVVRTLKVCQTIAFRQFCSNLLRGLCVCAHAASYSQAAFAFMRAGASAQAVLIRLKSRFPSEIPLARALPLSPFQLAMPTSLRLAASIFSRRGLVCGRTGEKDSGLHSERANPRSHLALFRALETSRCFLGSHQVPSPSCSSIQSPALPSISRQSTVHAACTSSDVFIMFSGPKEPKE